MKKVIKFFTILLFVFMLASCVGEATTYTVKFNTLGGSEVEKVVVEKGEELKLPEPPTKEGFEFGGWYTEEKCTNLYLEGTEITESMTLYAKWIEQCAITFVTNCEEEIEVIYVKNGEKAVLPKNPTKEGFEFAGWYTEEECENQYSENTAVVESFTLYAKWIKLCTVSFVTNCEETLEDVVLKEGEKLTQPELTKEGYVLSGWYTDVELENKFNFKDAVEEDLTLYASWTDATIKYNVTFDNEGVTSTVEVENGKLVAEPTEPTKEGFEFLGWYTDTEGENLFDFSEGVYEDVTLYAVWMDLSTEFDVTFNVDGAETIQKVVYKQAAVQPENPTKENYVFGGWYTDAEFKNEYNFATLVTKNVTLYAKWVSVFKVTFVVNGNSTTQNVVYGQKAVEPAEPEVANFAFYGWYTEETFDNEYSFDASVTGDVTLYAWLVQDTFVLQIAKKAEFTSFKAKKADTSDDETTFIIRTRDYLAGDDNMIKLTPVTQLGTDYDYDTEEFGTIYYGAWNYSYDLMVSEDGLTYAAADKATYVDSFDAATASIDFSAAAVGKFFKVDVYPQLLTETQEKADYTVSYELKVIDGFNVYDAKELAYCDNRSASHHSDSDNLGAWATYKANNNMDASLVVSTLILQKDISITTADFPAEFVYSADEIAKSDSDYARAVGSLKDYVDIFYHYCGENEQFHLYGNYFNLDCSTIPCVVREDGEITAEGTAISHSQLFFVEGASTATTTITDVSFLGNAPKVQNVQKAGGLILAKIQGSNHTTQNIVANGWFITFFPNYSLDPYLVDSCKAYDAFNSFIYNWGSPQVTIKDTIMKSAGGPIVISDHVHPENDTPYIGKTTFINCEMESYVTGEEGWFSVMGVSALVPVVKALDAVFNTAGKSFIKTQSDGTNTYSYMNMIAVNKSGNAQTATSEIVKGQIKIDDKSAFCFGEDNPYLAGMLEQCFVVSAPVFQADTSTATTGYCYFNGTQLIDITGQPLSEMSLFTSKYFCLYYNGMAITFELFDAGQTL